MALNNTVKTMILNAPSRLRLRGGLALSVSLPDKDRPYWSMVLSRKGEFDKRGYYRTVYPSAKEVEVVSKAIAQWLPPHRAGTLRFSEKFETRTRMDDREIVHGCVRIAWEV